MRIHIALIAGVKPAVAKHLRGLLRPAPVARENIRPADQNFVVLAKLHLDAGNGRAHAARIDVRGSSIVQMAVVSVRP